MTRRLLHLLSIAATALIARSDLVQALLLHHPTSAAPPGSSPLSTRRRISALTLDSSSHSHSPTALSSSSSSSSSPPSPTAETMIDSKYYTPPEPTALVSTGPDGLVTSRVTLSRFLSNVVKENPDLADLQNILLALGMSCKTISNLVNRAGLVYSISNDLDENDNDEYDGSNRNSSNSSNSGDVSPVCETPPDADTAIPPYSRITTTKYSDGRYYSMKRLDRLSTSVLKNALKFTGTVQMIAPDAVMKTEQPKQHQPGVLIAYDENFVACLDPLDGSGNADASICTGTVFGVFARNQTKRKTTDTQTEPATAATQEQPPQSKEEEDAALLEAVLQPAKNMRAAGYCLYSSATVLVFTFADGVYGFTLDPQIQEFVLTHDNLTIPPRGTVYSCNEANSEGWNEPWKKYLRNLKLGQGETQTRYAHRYVGSMVGDIHRTLLYGGMFAYPSDQLQKPKGNLQLLYKVAPMAYVVHHAGGKAVDEDGQDLLEKRPQRIHQKSPCFMGSPDDMDELTGYLKGLKT